MAYHLKPPRVVFRDERGRFLNGADRYQPKVAMIQVVRNQQYLVVSERMLPPEDLVNVLNHREFESLPEALIPKAYVKSTSKYKAWDVAEQIDRLKGVRRKQLKFTVQLQDGRRKREVVFYHKIKRNQKSSYHIFRRINQEIGLEGFYLYNRVGGKMLADRTGKQVKLLGIKVEEII